MCASTPLQRTCFMTCNIMVEHSLVTPSSNDETMDTQMQRLQEALDALTVQNARLLAENERLARDRNEALLQAENAMEVATNAQHALEATHEELVAEREERSNLQLALALLAERYVLCLRPIPLSCGSQYRMRCPMQVT